MSRPGPAYGQLVAASSSSQDLLHQHPVPARARARPPPPPPVPTKYSDYVPAPMSSPGPRAPSYPANLPPQGQRRSPPQDYQTANSIARGDVGSGYGPYVYEHSQNTTSSLGSSFPSGFRPSTEKFSSSPPSFTPRKSRLPNTTAVLPPYIYTQDSAEDDDALHHPDPSDAQPFILCSLRGWVNASTLLVLLLALLGLFFALPILSHYVLTPNYTTSPGFNVGGINGSGQIPFLPNMPTLVDKETPEDAKTRIGTDGQTYTLVFSDEFNTDGRSFYPGDDPYWEAADLHYWATGDLEWYDPAAITTSSGSLVITITKQPTHGLDYQSGMLTSWNKFCFSTGYVEVRVSLPGAGDVAGFWPGVWTMGNLGRAGYGASTEGAWPYSYDACDVGTFPNQQDKDGNPASSSTDGWTGGQLSGLPGQKLSACTCPGSDHPGPSTSVGRGVPEIDILEAQVDRGRNQGEVSQSLQIAPFNAFVKFTNSSPATTIYNASITRFNSFSGTSLQQSVSAVTDVDNGGVYNGSGFGVFGLEYWSDGKKREEGYVSWVSEGVRSWKVTSASVGPDEVSGVGQRLISEEPMYLIMNLGMSPSFEAQDFEHLVFPAKMYVDYVRVYQRADVDPRDGVGCDPPNYPTERYIQDHLNAYMNPNLTTWASAGYTFPRNSQYDGC